MSRTVRIGILPSATVVVVSAAMTFAVLALVAGATQGTTSPKLERAPTLVPPSAAHHGSQDAGSLGSPDHVSPRDRQTEHQTAALLDAVAHKRAKRHVPTVTIVPPGSPRTVPGRRAPRPAVHSQSSPNPPQAPAPTNHQHPAPKAPPGDQISGGSGFHGHKGARRR